MKQKLCSFLVPTRYRVESLKKMIKSFCDGADDINCFDFLIKVDYDDSDTINALPDIEKLHPSIRFIMTTLVGYNLIEKYITLLSHCTDAKWIGLIADDIFMTGGKGWDTQIAKFSCGDNFFLVPEISQIGSSSYGKTRTPDIGPAFIENRIWEKYGWDEIKQPCDLALYTLLVAQHGFKAGWLDGIRFHHPDHAKDDKLVISQGRQGLH